ncbi:restriction endonuclease [Candidatus Saccharibacteria bacterium]|nr:restriction endonuclease [Candidatus Saccharibacteria bacterium]
MPYRQRSFGWIQDAGEIRRLRSIAEIFVTDSPTHTQLVNDLIPVLVSQENGRDRFLFALTHEPIQIAYGDLKGKGPRNGETRGNACCSGIAQAVLPSQNGRPYSSDWATESFMRLAVSVGIIDYDNETDLCTIGARGMELVETVPGSQEEKEVFEEALLAYPPACRVLNLLRENGQNPMSKYAIGQKLGFIGERGFSSYPENLIAEALYSADKKEKKRIKSNVEGTSDKYSRMICCWLKQFGWVTSTRFNVHVPAYGGGLVSMTGYRITLRGVQALNNSLGQGRHPRIPKIVRFEMLATAERNSFQFRLRRAHLIKCLSRGSLTMDQIEEILTNQGCWAERCVIEDDIKGLINIGLSIKKDNDRYRIDDDIVGLSIPNNDEVIEDDQDDLVSSIKVALRTKLVRLDHKYLSLVDYAYDPNSSLLFELVTIDLFKELGFNSIHLGHSNKPDGILTVENHGVIIDNKSYSRGFSIPANQRREMKDYIDQNIQRNAIVNPTRWWERFPSTNTTFSYLFISSYFCGEFVASMNALSTQTNINGASISVENLLLLAEQIKSGVIDNQQFIKHLTSNSEIVIR